MYTHKCTCSHACKPTHTGKHLHIHTYMYRQMYAYAYIHVCIQIHICIITCMPTDLCMGTHSYEYRCMKHINIYSADCIIPVIFASMQYIPISLYAICFLVLQVYTLIVSQYFFHRSSYNINTSIISYHQLCRTGW